MRDEVGHEVMSMAELPGLGRYVQVRRHKLDLRYDQLAARLGREIAWVFMLEDDVLPVIELRMLVRLAGALDVDQTILMRHARQRPDHSAPERRTVHRSEQTGQRPDVAGDVAAEGE